MIPALNDGDIVFFKKYSFNKSLLKIGDIIIFYHPLKKIRLIKRVKIIKEFSLEVSGDNQIFSSDSNLFGAIQKEKIIGIVTSKISNNIIPKINIFNP
tara:strand:- start:173 stop:466 length:294 start_codon:yes stop_codon:yes gene_type:complete